MSAELPLLGIPFALIAVSFLFGQRLPRHLLAFLGGLGTAWAYREGAPPVFYFGLAMAAINLTFLIHHAWMNICPLNEREKHIFRNYFEGFTRGEFKKLMSIAERDHKAAGSTIAAQGRPMNRMLLIVDGKASVIQDRVKIAELVDGDLVGEMSYIGHSRASATVRSEVLTTYLVWRQEDLRALLKRNVPIMLKFNKLMERQVARKLLYKETQVA